MPRIQNIKSSIILDSRANWTIATRVYLNDGTVGYQTVPAGASTGLQEAISLPADKAVQKVPLLLERFIGMDVFDQQLIDKTLIETDGTYNKSNLGGNTILSISLACAKAAATCQKTDLYKYLAAISGNDAISYKFPVPIFNVFNGGKHADNGLSFQEFMIIPNMNMAYNKALELGVNVYHKLQELLRKDGLSTAVGDEGGFAPKGFDAKRVLDYLTHASSQVGTVGQDVFFGIDAAANSFFDPAVQYYKIEETHFVANSAQLSKYYLDLIQNHPIIYLEDGFYENDHNAWVNFSKEVKNRLFVVGDDLVVTNTRILTKAIENNMINAVIVKPNQIGTLTETIEFIKLAKLSGLKVIVSHRSGETAEDTFIADLALAVEADFIKSGAPARGGTRGKIQQAFRDF